MSNDFLLIAHRGGLFHKPENSCAAFQFCVDNGVEWVECDVRLTSDGCPVVVHDDRVPLNGEKVAVRDLTFAELESYKFGEGERVPLLADVLKEFGASLRFNLEIKELDAARRIMALIQELGLESRVIITSFLPDVLDECRNLNPTIERGLLIDRLAGRLSGRQNVIQGAILLGCRYLMLHFHRVNPDLTQEAHREGLLVIPWTVNLRADIDRMRRCGVDGLITDKPLYVRAKLAGLKAQ